MVASPHQGTPIQHFIMSDFASSVVAVVADHRTPCTRPKLIEFERGHRRDPRSRGFVESRESATNVICVLGSLVAVERDACKLSETVAAHRVDIRCGSRNKTRPKPSPLKLDKQRRFTPRETVVDEIARR